MRKVLRALGHVTREGVIALKGRAACELNTADELVVGELLMEGVFQDLDAAVAVALLSCLCHTEKAKEGGKVCPFLQSDSCQYGSNCRFQNECFICGDRKHGANKCPLLESNRAKDKLGI